MYLFLSLCYYVQNGWWCAGREDGKRGGSSPGQQQRQDGEAYRNSQQSGRDLELDKIKVLCIHVSDPTGPVAFLLPPVFLQIRIPLFSIFAILVLVLLY